MTYFNKLCKSNESMYKKQNKYEKNNSKLYIS